MMLTVVASIVGAHWSARLDARTYTNAEIEKQDAKINRMVSKIESKMDALHDDVNANIDKMDVKIDNIENDMFDIKISTVRIQQLLEDFIKPPTIYNSHNSSEVITKRTN